MNVKSEPWLSALYPGQFKLVLHVLSLNINKQRPQMVSESNTSIKMKNLSWVWSQKSYGALREIHKSGQHICKIKTIFDILFIIISLGLLRTE